jgi:flagellar hook protein FlgE
MTALSSVYVSVTSLLSFSKALDTISNNVANLNTVGFKASDLYFSAIPGPPPSLYDVPEGFGRDVIGSGTTVSDAGRRFIQGELRETGSPAHFAVSGSGFFVLRDALGLLYSRAGQFQVDAAGHFVDPESGAFLQALSGSGLQDLVIDPLAVFAPSPTTKVTFAGTLSTGSTTAQVKDVAIIDANGERRLFTLDFTNTSGTTIPGSTTPLTWNVSVKDASGNEVANGELRFLGSGTAVAGFDTIQFNVVGTGGRSTPVILDFSATNSLSASSSTVQVSATDGFATGRLTHFAFDQNGASTLTFSNGQTRHGVQIALASFADPQLLESEDGTRFRAPAEMAPRLGAPGTGGLGTVVHRSVELANVELAREFADIIILQRGFQASSQILNVSSQLIEDIYNSVSGRQ